MKYSLRCDGLTLTDLDREQLDEKIDRLHTHLVPPFIVDVRIAYEHLRSVGESIVCKISVEQGKKVFHADRTNSTVQNALDDVLQALRKILKKEQDKHKRHGGGVQW